MNACSDHSWVHKFLKERSGYAAVSFAISALPMVALAGLTIDASLAYRYKTNLQAAADATTLAMARRSVMDPSMSEGQLLLDGRQMFERHIDGQKVPDGVNYDIMAIDRSGVEAKMKVSLDYQLSFGALVGMPKMTISVDSLAIYNNAEIDFYMLLDNSPSMALGADQFEIDRMEAEFGCAFACHGVNGPEHLVSLPNGSMPAGYSDISDVPNNAVFNTSYDLDGDGAWSLAERQQFLTDNGIPPNWESDTYYDAKERGILLRFDAVKAGVAALADRVEDIRAIADQFRIGLYHFGTENWDMEPVEVLPLTDDMRVVQDEVADIPIMLAAGVVYANTPFEKSLEFVGERIQADLDSEPNSIRNKVIFLMTDGLINSHSTTGDCGGVWPMGPGVNQRCHEPIRAELCQAYKDKGIKVAVLHTPYVPLQDDSWYDATILPFADQIAVKAEQCASPGLYYKADLKTSSIEEGMVELLDKTSIALRLAPTS